MIIRLSVAQEAIGFHSKWFSRMTQGKLAIQEVITAAGYSVLFSDVDVAWTVKRVNH
jgi:hypothetical protein